MLQTLFKRQSYYFHAPVSFICVLSDSSVDTPYYIIQRKIKIRKYIFYIIRTAILLLKMSTDHNKPFCLQKFSCREINFWLRKELYR